MNPMKELALELRRETRAETDPPKSSLTDRTKVLKERAVMPTVGGEPSEQYWRQERIRIMAEQARAQAQAYVDHQNELSRRMQQQGLQQYPSGIFGQRFF